MLIDTTGSVFDMPYALAHGLLILYEQRPEDTIKWVGVDLSKMGEVDKNTNIISVFPHWSHEESEE